MTVEEMHATEDAVALERFEALVFSQQPASEPWAPVTDYSFEARKIAEGQHPDLILRHLIPCDDAEVLDYGCGPDAHLVRLLAERVSPTSHVLFYGYDPQRTGSEANLEARYDLVICREVLEHLTIADIAKTVRQLCALSLGFVYVTTRFHPHPVSLLDVATHDDLDPTHITMLNQTFLRVLFVLEGFKRRADLEAQLDWMQKGRCLVYERV